MSDPKALFAEFRAAPWASMQALEEFITRCDGLPQGRVRELLEIALRPPSGTQPRQQQAMLAAACKIVQKGRDTGAAGILVGGIRDADPSIHRFLIPTLIALNDASWHAACFGLLRHRDERVRQSARDVLVKVGGKTVFGLAETSVKENWQTRAELIDVIAEVAGHHGIPMLGQLMAVGDRGDRMRILQVLGDERYVKVRKDEAAYVLKVALEDADPAIRGRAAASLGKLGDGSALERISELTLDPNAYCAKSAVSALASLVDLGVKGSITALAAATRAPVLDVQAAAVEALGRSADPDAVPALVRVLEAAPLALRNAAIDALGNIGRSGRTDLARILVIMMNNPSAEVRRAVVEVIGLVGDPDGTLWRRLVRVLRDEDWWVRERATEVLVEVGGKRIVPHVIELLSDGSDVVRRYAVEVLLRLRAKEAVAHLAKAARDDLDWWVKERAIEALGELGDNRVVPLLVQLLKDPEYHFVTVQALGKLKDPRAVPYIGPLLEVGEPDFRLMVARVLAEIGSDQAIGFLQDRVIDPDREVRRFVLQALHDHSVRLDTRDIEAAARSKLSLVEELLERTREAGGTDLYFFAGSPPAMKKSGRVTPLLDRALTADDVGEALGRVLAEEDQTLLDGGQDVDAAFQSRGARDRYRVHAFRKRGGVNVVFRVIRDEIMPWADLGLPDLVLDFTAASSGLVIVAGPSSSGKTTTLSALIDHINRTSARHVLTLEDPIEALHKNARSLVHQREVGVRRGGARRALRGILRQDPDVILIGEMRDLDTVSFAVTAAETGHLVLGTFHTASAAQTVERLIDIFPTHQQSQVRAMVSESLQGVVCQQLLDRADGLGRVLAAEVLINTSAVANLIRQNKAYQIPTVLATSYEAGMRLMDRELVTLVERGLVRADEAYAKAQDKKLFERFFADPASVPKDGALPPPAASPPAPAAPAAVPPPSVQPPPAAAASAPRPAGGLGAPPWAAQVPGAGGTRAPPDGPASAPGRRT